MKTGLLLLALLLPVGGAVYALVPWRQAGTPPDSAAGHWRQAQAALARRDLEAARGHLERCLEAAPLHAHARFLLARTCRRAGDFNAWQQQIDRAEALQWSREELHLEYHLRQAQSGDLAAVERELLSYLDTLPPEEVLILEAVVQGYLLLYRLNDALYLTNKWVERFPDDWQARLYRARALPNTYRIHRERIAEYRKVLELRPGQPEAHLQLGRELMIVDEFPEAVEQFEAYLRVRPDATEALFGIANCRMSQGQEPATRAALARLLERKPDHAPGLLIQAKLDLAQGAAAEALQALERADAAAPNEPDILHNLDVALRQLGRHDQARQCQERMQAAKRRNDQIHALEAKIRQAPGDLNLRYEAARLCLDLRYEKEAAEWFTSILWLDPEHGPTHRALAEYYEKKGDRARAEQHRRHLHGKPGGG